MTSLLRSAVSCFLWWWAAVAMTLAARFDRRPRPVQRFVLDGLTAVPVDDLGGVVLRPQSEWLAVLNATHTLAEQVEPRARA